MHRKIVKFMKDNPLMYRSLLLIFAYAFYYTTDRSGGHRRCSGSYQTHMVPHL